MVIKLSDTQKSRNHKKLLMKKIMMVTLIIRKFHLSLRGFNIWLTRTGGSLAVDLASKEQALELTRLIRKGASIVRSLVIL